MAARDISVFASVQYVQIAFFGNPEYLPTAKTRRRENDLVASFELWEEGSIDEEKLERSRPDMIVLHDSEGAPKYDQCAMIGALRAMNYRGVIVVLAEDPSIDSLIRALIGGADDYWVSNASFDIEREALRMLGNRSAARAKAWNPDAIGEMGLLRSVGLTKKQINILIEFARDFPRQSVLAKRVGSSEGQLRKMFSRVYQKLEGPLAVESQAQLAQLLSICAMSR